MKEYRISFSAQAGALEGRLIDEGLSIHNDMTIGPKPRGEINVMARDEVGELVGGVIATTYADLLRVKNLWVKKEVTRGGACQGVDAQG